MKQWGPALVLCVLALAPAAHAQPAPGAPSPPEEPPQPPTEPAEPAADADYDQAFAALLAGDFAAAERGFAAVSTRSPDPERRAAARELARLAAELRLRGARLQLRAGGPAGTPGPGHDEPGHGEPGHAHGDEPDAGRASFIVTTTLASFYSAFFILDLLDTSDVRPGTLVVMGTTALGLLGSLYGTRGRTMTAGMADSYGLGIGIGVGNAMLLTLPMDQVDSSEEITGLILSGIIAGGAVGLYAGYQFRPTSGQVGYVADTSILGLATAGLGLLVVQPDVDADTVMLTLAGGLDLGLAFGIATADGLDWSPSRQRLVSLGIFLGAVAGGGVTALIFGNDGPDDDETAARVVGSATLIGLWGGFGLTWYLTREMKPDPRYARPKLELQAQPTVLQTPDGLRPGLALAGRF